MLPDNPTTIDYLRDILVEELDIADSRVNLYNTKFDIPNDRHLFVMIAYKMSKPFASKSETDINNPDTFDEHQCLNTQEHYSIMLFSRNEEALHRKEEAVMALSSVYARQQGDHYGFKIFRIAPIQDLSTLEGAAIIYRYDIDIVMFCRYEKTKTVNWYGTFGGAITIENGNDVTTIIEPIIPS